MNTLLWIPCATIILTICTVHVRTFNCRITLCSIPNFCGNGRECHTYPDTCQSKCVCTDNVTHELCSTDEVKLSTNSPGTWSKTSTMESPDTRLDEVSNTEAPLTQNTDCLNNFTPNTLPCPSGIPCFYGDCVVDNLTGVGRCDCYPGATGHLCSEPCCLDCGPYGVCGVNMADRTQYCNCHPDYKGERCAMPVENPGNPLVQVEEETWYLWLVCVVVLFMLLLVLIVLPYLMWKNRVIVIMKIVHYFHPYEDQDDRIWDAVVLYRSDPVDEEFVLRKLYPMLEEMGFKINIHFKDIAVVETIANNNNNNNIIHAVQNSKRTILVMSKNYVKSEFTRLEYQCAQQEVLQKKHRIIPILLEDITEIRDTTDPTLKAILSSVTCIMWPGERNPKELQKFWKRLELSMPKRRMVEEDVTGWPESITIHAINSNTQPDLMNNAINK